MILYYLLKGNYAIVDLVVRFLEKVAKSKFQLYILLKKVMVTEKTFQLELSTFLITFKNFDNVDYASVFPREKKEIF